MEPQQNSQESSSNGDHGAETALLLRLETLEKIVFGHTKPAHQEVRDLHTKVDAITKEVNRVDGGNRELRDVAKQASALGVLTHLHSRAAPAAEPVALKENILIASRGEIEEIAKQLATVSRLEQHINPSYLRDVPDLMRRLTKMEGTYVGQAADTTLIEERAESTRLHYSQAITLVSEKFVHWDDRVATLERQHSQDDSSQAS